MHEKGPCLGIAIRLSQRDNQMLPLLQLRSAAKCRVVKSGFEEVIVVAGICYNVHTYSADFDFGDDTIRMSSVERPQKCPGLRSRP